MFDVGAGSDSTVAKPADGPESTLEPETDPTSRSWAEITAVPPRQRGPRVGAFRIIAIVGVLTLVAAFVALSVVLRNEQGQVMFTTTDPNGGNGCVVLDKVSAVDRGTHVWMVVMFNGPMDDKPITMQMWHNGGYYWGYTWPVDDSKGRMCTWGDDMFAYPSGTWRYTFTHGDETEASGTLTIR